MIHHIEIYVSNLESSRIFYSWLLSELGYTLYQDWSEGFSYKFKDTYIVFVQTREKHLSAGYHRARTGLNHLAFRVDSTEKVDHITQALLQKNITLLYEDKHPHASGPDYYAVYFEDPDRIKLEIVAEF